MRTGQRTNHRLRIRMSLPLLLLWALAPATSWSQAAPLPSASPILSTTLLGGGQVQLIWRATLGQHEQAALYRQSKSAGPEPLNMTDTANATVLDNGQTQDGYRDTSARRGTEYRYWLQVESKQGKLLRRSEVSTLTVHDQRPPGRIAGLTAHSGTDQITLHWTAPDDPEITQLTLYRRAFDHPPTIDETGRGDSIAELSPTQTDYVDRYVKSGKRYYYRIAATDPHSGEGPDSYAALSALMDIVSPPPVPLFEAMAGEGGRVRLVWHASLAPDVSVYRIYRSVDNGHHEMLIQTMPASDQPGFDHVDRLDPASPFTYRYRVVAVDLSGNASPSSPVFTVRLPDHTPPGAPVITGISASDGGIWLNWAAPPDRDVVGYHVYRRSDADDGSGQRINLKPHSGPPVTDQSVADGGRYGYRVTAIDRAGNESSPSRWVTQRALFRVVGATPPERVRVTTTDNGHPVVKWATQNNPRIRGYRVLRGDSPEPGVQVSPLLTQGPFVDIFPLSGSTWYRVQTLYRNGLASEPSNPVAWAPKEKRP